MDALIGFLNNPVVLTGAQLLFGLAIKKVPALEAWPNKLIPLFNGVLALLIKLAGPADANASGIGDALRGFGSLALEAALQTLLTTGIHSSAKNVWQNLLVAAVKRK